MSSARGGHRGKSLEQRREYYTRVVRGPQSTVEEHIVDIDSTETPLAPQEIGPLQPTRRSPVQKEWLLPTLISVLLVALVGYLGWLGLQLFELNREMGELRTILRSLEQRDEELREDLRQTEARLESAVEENASAIEEVEGQTRQRPTGPPEQ